MINYLYNSLIKIEIERLIWIEVPMLEYKLKFYWEEYTQCFNFKLLIIAIFFRIILIK